MHSTSRWWCWWWWWWCPGSQAQEVCAREPIISVALQQQQLWTRHILSFFYASLVSQHTVRHGYCTATAAASSGFNLMRNKCSQQRARFRTVVIESTALAKSCSQLLCKRVTVNTSSAVVPSELESSSSITKFLDSEANKPRLSSSSLLSQIESDPKRTLSLLISLWICC